MKDPNTIEDLDFSYMACGLELVSDIKLPGLIPSEKRSGSPEVQIVQGDVPTELDRPLENSGPNWQLSENVFLLRAPGVGRFLIKDAREIVFQPEGDLPPEELTAFLTGSVMGLLQHLRGRVVLHASAMLVNGKAVLFCGQSGAGKSTMAAALGRRNYTMLSDDLCALDYGRDGPPLVFPDGRKHKLWEKAIDKLNLKERQGDGVRHQIHKFYVEPSSAQIEPAPIAAVYDLREARAKDAFEIEQPNLADAAMIIRRNAFRPRIMWQLGQKVDYFQATTKIASNGGVFILKRPLNFKQIDETVDKLEQHWQEIGLGEQ